MHAKIESIIQYVVEHGVHKKVVVTFEIFHLLGMHWILLVHPWSNITQK